MSQKSLFLPVNHAAYLAIKNVICAHYFQQAKSHVRGGIDGHFRTCTVCGLTEIS